MTKSCFESPAPELSISTGWQSVWEITGHLLGNCASDSLRAVSRAGPDFARMKREAPLALTSPSTHAARRLPSCAPRRMRPYRNVQNVAVFPLAALGFDPEPGCGV